MKRGILGIPQARCHKCYAYNECTSKRCRSSTTTYKNVLQIKTCLFRLLRKKPFLVQGYRNSLVQGHTNVDQGKKYEAEQNLGVGGLREAKSAALRVCLGKDK